MKKVIVSAIIMSAVLTTPVFADEILFRDIPWGSTFPEAEKLTPDISWFSFGGATFGRLATLQREDYSAVDMNSDNNSAQYMSVEHSNILVAGYKPEDINMFFALVPEGGEIINDASHTSLYAGQYIFYPENTQEVGEDLLQKLTSLYGEPKEVTTGNEFLYTYYSVNEWDGDNGSSVFLLTAVSDSNPTENRVCITYTWDEGDKLLDHANEVYYGESNAIGNGNTDGL